MPSPDTYLCSPVAGRIGSRSCIGTGTASRCGASDRRKAAPFGDGLAERRREITAQELGALLSGIDLKQATRRKRYRPSV